MQHLLVVHAPEQENFREDLLRYETKFIHGDLTISLLINVLGWMLQNLHWSCKVH